MSVGTYVKTGDYICIRDTTIGLDTDKQYLTGMVSNILGDCFILKTPALEHYKLSFASIGKRYSIVSINGKRVEKDILDAIRYSGFGLNSDKKSSELPKPKTVLANYKNGKDYVTVIWQDGTHTVICRNPEDEYDVDKAIMYAALKKMCGNNSSEMNRYLKSFHKCHKACRKWNKNYSKKLAESLKTYNKED